MNYKFFKKHSIDLSKCLCNSLMIISINLCRMLLMLSINLQSLKATQLLNTVSRLTRRLLLLFEKHDLYVTSQEHQKLKVQNKSHFQDTLIAFLMQSLHKLKMISEFYKFKILFTIINHFIILKLIQHFTSAQKSLSKIYKTLHK